MNTEKQISNTQSENMEQIENGSITSVKGFTAAGIHCGIKKKRKDLALICSDAPARVAAVFTKNSSKAACIIINENIVAAKETCRAILVNSGNANACTGLKGMEDAEKMQLLCAQKLNISSDDVLVASTGIIGKYLPLDKISNGISAVADQLLTDGGLDAAEAIRTTDTFAKHCAYTIHLSGGDVTIGCICKGSGMIMPNMATMLAFITTDLQIDRAKLQDMLSHSVNISFNRINVDGETSTNDMVCMLANGKSNVKLDENTDDEARFTAALESVCIAMAKTIVTDGEGATKIVTLHIKNAESRAAADAVGKFVTSSLLVKTALYGNDPNWGRIFSAIGNSNTPIDPSKITLYIDDLEIVGKNLRIEFDEQKAAELLAKREVTLTIDMNLGAEHSTWWTCDLTNRYVEINSAYRS